MCARTCCTLDTLRPHLWHHTFLQNVSATDFLRAARHPADSDGPSNRWCPGTGQQSAALVFCACFSPKAQGTGPFVGFAWIVSAFDWSCCLVLSPAVVPHMEKVHSIVRQIYGRSPTDDLNDLDVNTAMWRKFMNVTLQAAVHLCRDYWVFLK